MTSGARAAGYKPRYVVFYYDDVHPGKSRRRRSFKAINRDGTYIPNRDASLEEPQMRKKLHRFHERHILYYLRSGLLAVFCIVAGSFAVIAWRSGGNAIAFARMVFDIANVRVSHWEDFTSLRWSCFGAFNATVQIATMVYVMAAAPRSTLDATRHKQRFSRVAGLVLGVNLFLGWPYLLASWELAWSSIESTPYWYLIGWEADPRWVCIAVATIQSLAPWHIALAVSDVPGADRRDWPLASRNAF